MMPPIKFPTPMVGLAVMPKTRGDEAKLSGALHKIVEEDSTFRIDRDPQTKELVMTGMSELHLMILRERLKRRDKVEVEVKEPKIPYRETVQHKAEGSYRHKKQSGGRGQFGEVHIRMFPVSQRHESDRILHQRSTSRTCANSTTTKSTTSCGSIRSSAARFPNNFLPAVEKGFMERMDRGVIAGYQVQNVGVEVHFGKYHDVDSSEAAFKTAGSMAFRNVFQEAKPSLLEPIVKLHITVPSNKVGDVNSDMSGRRGRVLGMEAAGGDLQTVTGHGAAGGSDHLRPQPVEHDRRPGELHDGIQPLRRRARQRAKGDHREGRDGERGRRGIETAPNPSRGSFLGRGRRLSCIPGCPQSDRLLFLRIPANVTIAGIHLPRASKHLRHSGSPSQESPLGILAVWSANHPRRRITRVFDSGLTSVIRM